MKEEKLQSEINLILSKPIEIRSESGATNIDIPDNEMVVLGSIVKDLTLNV